MIDGERWVPWWWWAGFRAGHGHQPSWIKDEFLINKLVSLSLSVSRARAWASSCMGALPSYLNPLLYVMCDFKCDACAN